MSLIIQLINKMDKTFKIVPPSMPNYAKLDKGSENNDMFPITNFTEKEAIEYGELMKQTFIEHWKKKKNVK